MSAETELRAVITAIDRTAPGVSSASARITGLGGVVDRMATGMATRLAGMAGGWLALDKVIGVTMDGIRNASELRDLHAQIASVDGSIREAAKSLAFFDEAQSRTRRTGDEMAQVYGELLPRALAKGFSRETFREVIVELDQVATAIRKTPSEVNEAFAQILSGKARANNTLLSAFGIDPESIKSGKIGIEELLGFVKKKAEDGAKLGDDFAAGWAKTKDSMLDSFSKGFNEARGSAEQGMKGITNALTSPDVLGALEDLGGAIAEIGPLVGKSVTAGTNAVMLGIGSTMAVAGAAVSGLSALVEKSAATQARAFDAIASPAERHPIIAQILGLNPAGVRSLRTMSDWFGDFSEGAKAVGSGAADLAVQGADLVSKALEPVEDSIKRITTSTEKGRDHFASIATSSGRVASNLARLPDSFFKIPAIVAGGVDPSINQQTLADAKREHALSRLWDWDTGFGSKISLSEDTKDRTQEAIRAWLAANAKARHEWQGTFATLSGTLGAAGVDFARNAGANIGEIAAKNFDQLVGTGAENLLGTLFGAPTEKNGKWFIPGSTQPYDSEDAAYGALPASSLARMQKAQAALDVASIGMGAYGAGLAGDGGRTGATISGGIAGIGALSGFSSSFGGVGAAMGISAGAAAGLVGAVAGLLVGAIGSYLGEKERQSNYKYGIPMIDAGGVSSIIAPKNLTTLEREQIIAQVQDTYERTRNAGVRTLMTLGQDIDSSVFKPILGQFQPEASANWGKHLQQWMSMGLPDEVMGQMKGQFKAGFGTVGMSGERFDALWAQIDRLDPQKAIAMLSGIATGLTDIDEAMDFLDARNGFGGNTSWFTGMLDVQKEMSMSFADVMGESMDAILEKASYLDDLVGEDQVSLLREIGSLTLDVRQREREEIRAILQLQESLRDKAQSTVERYTVMGMVKKDGTPDYEKQADFFQRRADDELADIFRATNKEDVSKSFDDFLSYIDHIVSAGFSISPEQGQDWLKWAMDQIEKGRTAADTALSGIGKDVQDKNAEFIAQFQPIIDKFTTSVGDATGPTDRLRDGFDFLIPKVIDTGTQFATLSVTVQEFTAEMRNALIELRSGSGSSSSFESDTAASRVG